MSPKHFLFLVHVPSERLFFFFFFFAASDFASAEPLHGRCGTPCRRGAPYCGSDRLLSLADDRAAARQGGVHEVRHELE